MSTNKLWIFWDHDFVLIDKKQLRSLEPGVLKARGVFETFPCYNRRPVAFAAHMKRLNEGFRILKISHSRRIFEYKGIIRRLLDKNRIRNARVRLAVWKEGGEIRIAVVCHRLEQNLNKNRGVHALIAEQVHVKHNPSIKSLDYARFRRAFQEAQRKGREEAIFLNRDGRIVEGSRTNIFIVKEGRIYTPRLQERCLPGVMRAIVLKHAKTAGLNPCETRLLKKDLWQADEAFVTNSVIGIRPLIRVDAKNIPAGPVTHKLIMWYKQAKKRL